jgi:hypothetical protein
MRHPSLTPIQEEDAVTDTVALPAMSPGMLAGHAVIARIRRVLIVALIAGIVYGTFTLASSGGCAGGYDGAGGFVDGAGQPTDVAPVCMDLTLRPSPFTFLAIGAIVLLAIGRVREPSTSRRPCARSIVRRSASGCWWSPRSSSLTCGSGSFPSKT